MADHEQLVLAGFKELLTLPADLEVIGTARTLADTVLAVPRLRPDVVVLGMHWPDGGVLEAVAELSRVAMSHVVLLGSGEDEAERAAAFRAGARALVHRDVSPEHLSDGIRAVARGEPWPGAQPPVHTTETASAPSAVDLASASSVRPLDTLTVREREVLKAVGDGLSNADISSRLAISTHTVKHHLSSLFDKTGASSRVELALLAVRFNLTSS